MNIELQKINWINRIKIIICLIEISNNNRFTRNLISFIIPAIAYLKINVFRIRLNKETKHGTALYKERIDGALQLIRIVTIKVEFL